MHDTPLRFGVIGNPVQHSLSPIIHQHFAEQFKINLTYERILSPIDSFSCILSRLQKQNFFGVNVTAPFKEQAFALVNDMTERAKIAKSVNTIHFTNSKNLVGDNTDGVGLVQDLTKNIEKTLTNQNILIFGAGGAVRGILYPLILANPKKIIIANRTITKAWQIQKDFEKKFTVEISDLKNIPSYEFGIVINATSSKINIFPDVRLAPQCCCYDMSYSNKENGFLNWATQKKAKQCFNGLGMLVEQAAESFYFWHQCKPKTKTVLKNLEYPHCLL